MGLVFLETLCATLKEGKPLYIKGIAATHGIFIARHVHEKSAAEQRGKAGSNVN
jgi:phage protein U